MVEMFPNGKCQFQWFIPIIIIDLVNFSIYFYLISQKVNRILVGRFPLVCKRRTCTEEGSLPYSRAIYILPLFPSLHLFTIYYSSLQYCNFHVNFYKLEENQARFAGRIEQTGGKKKKILLNRPYAILNLLFNS